MRLVPTVTGLVVGGLDGWMRKTDVDKARITLSKQYGTYLEIAEALTPFIADAMRLPLSRETTDAIGIAGAAMLGDRLIRSQMSGSFGTGSPAAISGVSYVGAPMVASPYSAPAYRTPMGRAGVGFAQKVPSVTIV